MAFHVGRSDWQLAWDASVPPLVVVPSGSEVSFDVLDASCGQITAESDDGRPRDAGLLARRPGRPGRSTSKVPSPVTSSRSSCSSSSRPTGAGPRASRASACWRTTFPMGRCGSRGSAAASASCCPACGSRWRRSAASSASRLRASRGARSRRPSAGGNMDTRHLTAGSRLWLPVPVPGAAFSLGDGHAAQGDGEVCGTAIETPMRARVRLTRAEGRAGRRAGVRDAGAAGDLDEHGRLVRVPTASSPDLFEAARAATRTDDRAPRRATRPRPAWTPTCSSRSRATCASARSWTSRTGS